MLKTLSLSILCLAVFSDINNDSFAHSPKAFQVSVEGFFGNKPGCSEDQAGRSGKDYHADIYRLIALRSHPLDELISLAVSLEAKWRRLDWNQYAVVMGYVCSEISNRGLNDVRVREQTEHFARVALSHSNMYLWEHEANLVGALGYRLASSNSAWLRERREKTELWLEAWRRLEREFDPSFDVNDREQLPRLRVSPPYETGLPAGTPPSAIKDPKLRAQYEAAIAENKRKSQRVDQQFPLLARGPSFKARAEHWLIGCYSLPPARNAELKRLLEIYLRDAGARERIIIEVEKNNK